MEAYIVRAVEAERLESGVLRLMVEYSDAEAVWDRHVSCDDTLPCQLVHIYPSHGLCLLEDAKVHIFLHHSVQGIFEAAILPVAYFV